MVELAEHVHRSFEPGRLSGRFARAARARRSFQKARRSTHQNSVGDVARAARERADIRFRPGPTGIFAPPPSIGVKESGASARSTKCMSEKPAPAGTARTGKVVGRADPL